SLKIAGSKRSNISSAVIYPGPNKLKLLAIACYLIHLDSVSNVCSMDNHPPARRPHKSPAHTVKDPGLRPQRLVRSPLHQSARGSRTSYSEFQGRQHLTAPFFTAVPALRSVPQDVPISGARIEHSHTPIGKRVLQKNSSALDDAPALQDVRPVFFKGNADAFDQNCCAVLRADAGWM